MSLLSLVLERSSFEHIIGDSDSASTAENMHGGRDRDRELREHAADAVAQERDGREHRDEHDRRRDDGERDLARAVERREQRRLARLDAPVRVLEHDDRVVDDEADRQREREQRDEIDRDSRTAASTENVAIRQIGIVTSGISVARSEPKNTKITKPTSAVVMPIVQ